MVVAPRKLMAGKEEIPPNWVEFPLPPGSLHGDPMCLKDEASIEPLHTNSDHNNVGGPSCRLG